MQTVRYAEAAEQRWRNDGGVTRELFRDERWRLSVATIEAAGEFSKFDGLDRVFVVAQGVIELTVNGHVHLLEAGEMLRFTGEDLVSAVPEGEVKAVNVMARRPLRARVRIDQWTSGLALVSLRTLDGYLDVDNSASAEEGRFVVVEEIA
ncbi:HutD/Ves family protein [Kineosporia babensis]|uniref:HutD family protein n=1 Tax=Kineosporia babensis TaxID=499548 RepID=A0A9X1NMW1_9ACTN|nr:HutD family protein [Kineosporia babensis]